MEFICPFSFLYLLLPNLIRSSISPPGSKQKSASDDRDTTISVLLEDIPGGRLGPQWIRPTPPRLPLFDGEVKLLSQKLHFNASFLSKYNFYCNQHTATMAEP